MTEGYPVNSPTCKLAYPNSPTPTGELAYVGEFEHQHKRGRCPQQLCKMCYSSFFYPLPIATRAVKYMNSTLNAIQLIPRSFIQCQANSNEKVFWTLFTK